MSILSQLMHGQITFSQAAQEAAGWASKVVSHDPTLANVSSAVLSDVKQAASNAVELADSALGKWIAPATAGIEAAADAALAGATGGVSVPFNPLINDGIDRIANAIKAEADAWALKAKAALVPAQPTTAPPTPAA